MSQANEPSQSSPRMRWFQFDLRLLFVIITAVGVILALEMARRSDADKAKSLTSTIRVGELVILSELPNGFEIKRQKGAHSHTVTEVGKDYVRLQSIDGPVSLIPADKIYRIVDDPRPYGATAATGGPMGAPMGANMGGASPGGASFGGGGSAGAGFGGGPGGMGMPPGLGPPASSGGPPGSSKKKRSKTATFNDVLGPAADGGIPDSGSGKSPAAQKPAPTGSSSPAAGPGAPRDAVEVVPEGGGP